MDTTKSPDYNVLQIMTQIYEEKWKKKAFWKK